MITISDDAKRAVAQDLVKSICRANNEEYDNIVYAKLACPFKMTMWNDTMRGLFGIIGFSDNEDEQIYVGYEDECHNPIFVPVEKFDGGILGLANALMMR